MFDDNTLLALANEYPLGFYVCDLDAFDHNYHEFDKAFRQHYDNVKIAYSYKTNYLPALCQRINAMGGYAEVVSRMEYDLAVMFGVTGDNIVLNGPLKTRDDYILASKNNSLVNLSEEYEVDLLKDLSRDYKELVYRVGIRCAIHMQDEKKSRFGFDVNSELFDSVINIISSLPNVRLEGLHCHMIPARRRPEDYHEISRRLVDISKKIWGKEGPGFLDLGGGYFSNMSDDLRRQFKIKIPTFSEYGKAITEPFVSSFGRSGRPQLILEPGLAMVADAIYFVCKVVDIKKVVDRNIALVAGSVYNIMPTKSPKNLPLRNIQTNNENSKSIMPPVDIVGYTCMEDDCLYRGYGENLRINDLLVFGNAGAYTLVLKPPFINGNVPVLAYQKESDEIEVLRREETLTDIIETYTIAQK
jgi:diaminopimelate decarboxylase